MFGQMEKMADEVPAVRAANQALKAKSENDDRVIAKDAELLAEKDKVQAATERALAAETKRADAELAAKEAIDKALAVSEADRTRLQRKVKKYRFYAVIGGVVSAALILLRP